MKRNGPPAPVSASVFLVALMCLLVGCGEQRGPLPNIILISIDTLRPDHLGCYGEELPTSPEIDRFRSDAVLFKTVIAQAPSTLPSHASIFTSLIPQHHQASHTALHPLSSAALTLTEVLRAAGYRTYAVVGGSQLAPVFGLNQGFDTYEVQAVAFSGTIARGLEILDQRSSSSPFFLFLHTYEVHHPYSPQREKLAKLEAGYRGPLPASISVELLREINSKRLAIDKADLAHIMHAYDAEIMSMDEAFGEFQAALVSRGLYENSVIVFMSDHGEEFGEHGIVGWHSHTLYDELLRIPLLVKLPQSRYAGATIGSVVESIDIAPTILDLVGLSPPRAFEGHSLLPRIEGGDGRDETAVVWRETRPDESGVKSGIRTPEWKLHDGRLFNLLRDPGEQHDLASQEPELVASLERRLESVIASARPLEPATVVVDEGTRKALRALGYVQ